MSVPHISVILPIYNVEDYLDACLSSIANQSFANLEVLMIDDGSNDTSPEICDRWAQQDPRFRVVHKKNGGVGSARNAGLEVAHGNFFSFVDPDDFLESGFFSALVQAQARCDSDLTIGRFTRLDETGRVIAQSQETEEISIPRSDFSRHLPQLFRERRLYYVYPKLYRSSSFQSIRFDERMRISEDTVWNADVLGIANSIQLTNHSGYRNIRYNNRGLTKQANLQQFQDHVRAYEKILRSADAHGWSGEELLDVLDERIMVWTDGALKAIRRGPWSLKQKIAYANKLCEDPILKKAFARLGDSSHMSRHLRRMRKGDGFGALMELMYMGIKQSTRKRIKLMVKMIPGTADRKRIP